MTLRLSVTCLVITVFCPVFAGDERTPLPERSAQAAAFTKVKEIYKADYKKRGKDAERTLAEKMLQQAEQLREDPTARYVMLREAARLASEAGDLDITNECADQLERSYDLDGIALRMDLLDTATKKASRGEESTHATKAYLDLSRRAIRQNRFEQAEDALKTADKFAGRSGDKLLEETVENQEEYAKRLAKGYEDARQAELVLKSVPDDPVANLTLGDYYCFMKNQWKKGLPHLAKGGDPVLSDLAKRELANPTEPKEKLAIGDGYWDRAESVPDEQAKLEVRKRAGYWYEQALGDIGGLEKVRLTQRLEQIEKAVAAAEGIEAADSLPAGDVFILTFEKRTLSHGGKRIEDLSSNKLYASTNRIEFAPGVAGRAAEFKEDGGLWFSPTEALQFNAPFSISLWVRTKNLSDVDGSGIIGVSDWQAQTGWSLGTSGKWGQLVQFSMMGGTERSEGIEFSQSEINDNKWHHIAATYDGSTAKLYLDGKLKSEGPYKGYRPCTTKGLSFGWRYIGMVDEVAIFTEELSSRDVKDLRKLGLRSKTLK